VRTEAMIERFNLSLFPDLLGSRVMMDTDLRSKLGVKRG
jgi:hypothetical protein